MFKYSSNRSHLFCNYLNCRHPELAAVCQDDRTLILYPGPKSQNLEELVRYRDVGTVKHSVIIIDGTWSQAKNMFLKNSMFHLPKQVCTAIFSGTRGNNKICIFSHKSIFTDSQRLVVNKMSQSVCVEFNSCLSYLGRWKIKLPFTRCYKRNSWVILKPFINVSPHCRVSSLVCNLTIIINPVDLKNDFLLILFLKFMVNVTTSQDLTQREYSYWLGFARVNNFYYVMFYVAIHGFSYTVLLCFILSALFCNFYFEIKPRKHQVKCFILKLIENNVFYVQYVEFCPFI